MTFQFDMRPLAASRFLASVEYDTNGGCWLWSAGCFTDGYARMNASDKSIRGHRYAWLLYNGPIPDSAKVCHRCDRRICVNPSHLFLGTQAENMADMVSKGRSLRGSKHNKAVLNEADILAIRAQRAAGLTLREIANAFNVSTSTVGMIVAGQTWRHVQ